MTSALSGALDLDDVDGLVASDVDGLLRATASSGALVRATASTVSEGRLDRLRGATVRSVVLAASPGPARHAADLVVAAIAATSTVPVLAVDLVPRWMGALDVLVVLSDDPGDITLAESVVRVAARGTEVVLATPEEGPLGAAGRSDSMRMPPPLTVAASASLPRFVAVGLSALAAAGVVEDADLPTLADVLDAESARDHPSVEVFASPAKALASRMAGRELVVVGAGTVSSAVARHGVAALLRHAGRVGAPSTLAEVLAAPVRSPGADAPATSAAALFHDPEIDGPVRAPSTRVLVVATAAEREPAARRLGPLPDAELVTVVDEQPGTGSGVSAVAAGVVEMMVLATRLETAAVYLRLAG